MCTFLCTHPLVISEIITAVSPIVTQMSDFEKTSDVEESLVEDGDLLTGCRETTNSYSNESSVE